MALDIHRKGKRMEAHYLAYFELHEIPWRLKNKVVFEERDTGMHFQIGKGPYVVPRMASPSSITVAGGARIETANETYTLEGSTYFGMVVPVSVEGDKDSLRKITPDWDELSRTTSDAAMTVGLCLDQRLPLKKVAAYVRVMEGRKPYSMIVRWEAISGAKASVSKRSTESIRRALGHTLDPDVAPQTLVALRWYDQSKSSANGADRFLALWIALEALMGPARYAKDVVKRAAIHLSGRAYRLDMSPTEVRQALGLDNMHRLRNAIVHHGYNPEPWPITPGDPDLRDWPQILSDIIGEILRYHLKATLTRSLNRHIITP